MHSSACLVTLGASKANCIRERVLNALCHAQLLLLNPETSCSHDSKPTPYAPVLEQCPSLTRSKQLLPI